MIADLIDRAATAFDSDRDAARALLFRAAAALRAARTPREQRVDDSTSAAASLVLETWQVDRILAHIDANIAETMRNAALARLVFLSTSHFSRAFAASVGVSPARYVLRRRIDFACRLMISTKLPLCEVAIASGLSDQAHFCRTFRRLFGQTPHAWRRANRRSEHVEDRLPSSGSGAVFASYRTDSSSQPA
jgi:AraC family transcriptional regulator